MANRQWSIVNEETAALLTPSEVFLSVGKMMRENYNQVKAVVL